MAKKNTSISNQEGFSSGLKISARMAANGSHSTMTTNFQPAKKATSLCSGWMGRSNSIESCPCWMRHSHP